MATQALYLKWRPQTFDDVIGQGHITRTLRNALRQERIRHAYLFSGPRGTGKTTTARLLAKAVNCLHESSDNRPCNQCSHCVAVNQGRFLDLIEIDAASHTSVDDVRDLRDKIAFSPSEGQYKVYIIDEVHRFSGAAFDALLKTLEEPPAHAIFVLATTELDKVPATIKSRCLLFEFRRVSLREVSNHLAMICEEEGFSADPMALELIARQGTGSVRDSISLLDQVVADPEEHISLELAGQILGTAGNLAVQDVIQAVIDNDAARGLDLLNEAIDRGSDPRQFGQQIVDHLRMILLVQTGGIHLVDASGDTRERLLYQSQHIGRGTLIKAIRRFNEAVTQLRGGWQPQLPLELALVESTVPVEDDVIPVAALRQQMPPVQSPPPAYTPPPPAQDNRPSDEYPSETSAPTPSPLPSRKKSSSSAPPSDSEPPAQPSLFDMMNPARDTTAVVEENLYVEDEFAIAEENPVEESANPDYDEPDMLLQPCISLGEIQAGWAQFKEFVNAQLDSPPIFEILDKKCYPVQIEREVLILGLQESAFHKTKLEGYLDAFEAFFREFFDCPLSIKIELLSSGEADYHDMADELLQHAAHRFKARPILLDSDSKKE